MTHPNMTLHIAQNPSAAVAACAQFISAQLFSALAERGIARIALAGGSTPKALYDLLARAPLSAAANGSFVDWARVAFYFGDERAVPQTHPDSNFGMANAHLFTPLGINASQVYPMVHEPMQPLPDEATHYQRQLKSWADNGVPIFDVMLNGMGEDGHFASLFPNTQALTERECWVVANTVEQLQTERLTLTYPVFEAARTVCFLATGAAKHPAFSALTQTNAPSPTARLVQHRRTEWFIDTACQHGSEPRTTASAQGT